MHLLRNLISCAALALAAAPLCAQVLTFDAARSRALESQPTLRALDLQARAAEESALADGVLPDPRLKLGALNFPTRNFPRAREDMTQWGVSYEQPIPGGDKLRLRTQRGLAEASQTKAEVDNERQRIEREVGLAWLEAFQADKAARLAGALFEETRRAIEAAGIGAASGRIPQAEIFGARQTASQAADRRFEFAAQAERARAMLRRWIPGATVFEMPAELPRWPDPAPLVTLAEALDHHPQHGVMLLAQSVAESDVALAREASKPDRSIEFGYFAREGQNRSDMIGVQVSFELPMWQDRKQDRLLAAKLKLAERVREQREDHLRTLRAELEAAYSDWRIAGERLANFDRASLPAAEGRLQSLLATHAAGRAELAAVLEARRQLIEARVQQLAFQVALAKARVSIAYFEHTPGEQK